MQPHSSLIPNTTQTPNIFLDKIMAFLKEGELRVMLYVIRRTYGFNKESDYISIGQFENGIVGKNGEQLDHGCGLNRKNTIVAIKSLTEMGILVKNTNQYVNEYCLNLSTDIAKVVSERHQCRKDTSSSVVKTPVEGKTSVVKTPTKPSIETKRNQVSEEAKNASSEGQEIGEARLIRDIIEAFGTINPACKKMYGIPTQRQACSDMIKTYSFERVMVIVLKTLPKTNSMPFFPSITTPLQLWQKWSTLESKVIQYQAEKKQTALKNKVAFN